MKLGDRVRTARHRICEKDRLGTITRVEKLGPEPTRFWVTWDEAPAELPYVAYELIKVEGESSQVFAEQDTALRDGRTTNRVVVHAGDGRVALLLNGEDIAPRVTRYTFSGPDKDGQWYLHATFPIDVPPNGDK